MDSTTLTAIITALPNLVIAIWVIRNQQDTIKALLDNQQKLIEQLMALHPPQTEDTAKKLAGKPLLDNSTG